MKYLKKLRKRQLSLIKPPIVEIELKSEIKELQLPPLPEEWLQF